jgi:hypothetical protein
MTSLNERCVTEPISFLRLERYRLHELSAREERAVSEHLAGCQACRTCFASIEEDEALPELPELPELPAPAKPSERLAELIELRGAAKRVRTRRFMAWTGSATGALALAAAALLMLRPKPDPFSGEVRPPRIGIKGGDVAVELVRQHRGVLAADSAVFADGDAFKVLVTCPPPLAPHFDVVVYQAGQAYFPLAAGTLASCGNRQALSGAFTLDGSDAAVVCVALDPQTKPSRERLGQGPAALPDLSVCARVAPEGTTR